MIFGVAFDSSCLIFIFILTCIYAIKKSVPTEENKIYSFLLASTFLSIILELLCYITGIIGLPIDSMLVILVSKFFLVAQLLWAVLFTVYIYTISLKKDVKKDRSKIIFSLIFLILSSVILISKINYYNDGTNAYSYGLGVYVVYLFVFLAIIFDIFCFVKKRKSIESYKKTPLIFLILLLIIIISIKMVYPVIQLNGALHAFVLFLMYFTIENPDLDTINQLEIAKDQADKANMAKTEFLSSMSHEIRTPLNAIVGFSDFVVNAETLDEAQENAKDIVSASNTLLEIVNSILDISKIEAGKMEIVNNPYESKEVFEDLAKLIKPRMDSKGLDFSYYIAPDIPPVLYGDHANMKKVITNLLSNAVKYTDAGFVRYTINCVNTNDVCKLIISVEDSGQGVKKENIDALFRKFQRLDIDKNATIEGTGLGLAITKQLVELMGGKIVVDSIYGEGSKFTIIISQKIEDKPIKKEVTKKISINFTDLKILLVDDNALNLKVASKLLDHYGVKNVTAIDNGFECIDRIKNGEKYDVILLDDLMPKMSGIQTLQKLKEIVGFDTPVIALTANALTGMKEKYIADGFDDYLAKPIEKDEFVRVINEIANSKKKDTINEESKESTSVSEESKELTPVSEESKELSSVNEEIKESTSVNEESKVLTAVEKESSNSISSGEDYLLKKGVDLDEALKLLGDIDMYNTTIKDFMNDAPEKFKRIKNYKKANDMENYVIEVHSLKSDCEYLGFMTLAKFSLEHEEAGKKEDSKYVEDNFLKLENEFHKVMDIINIYNQRYNN